MKNKKKILIISLLALVLVLGVGYAAVTGVDLKITGGSKVKDTQLRVRFEKSNGASATSTTIENNYDYSQADKGSYTKIDATCTASYKDDATLNTSTDNDVVQPMAATMTVENMTYIGQKATATYTILNYERDIDAQIACNNEDITVTDSQGVADTGEDAHDYFKVTIDTDGNPKTIGAKGNDGQAKSTTVVVTVELTKLPISQEDSSVTFSIPITATPKQPTP